MCLAERGQPLLPRLEVIERSHQKHGIGAAWGMRQGTGITDGGTRQWAVRLRRRRRARLLDQFRYRVDEVNVVSLGGQPARVAAGSAADIQDHPRRRRQEAPDQLPHAGELQRRGAAPEPPLFVVVLVVPEDVALSRRPTHFAIQLSADQGRKGNSRPQES